MRLTTCFGRRSKRALRLMPVLFCLPLLLHCGGSSGTGGIVEPTKPPVFTASGTASAPNVVTLASAGTAPGSLIQLDVKLGGPTTSSDLFAFAFDLVLSNPSVVKSVTVAAGDALTGQVLLPPATLTGDRVVVGISKAGGTGNGVGAAGATIVSLTLKMDPNTPGTTTLTFDRVTVGGTAQGSVISTVVFDSVAASITQPE